jgi:hypothetical protein
MEQAGFPNKIQAHAPAAVNSIPEATTPETATTAENQRLDVSTDVRKEMPWHGYML